MKIHLFGIFFILFFLFHSLQWIISFLFQVVSTNGDTHLGGEDFDQKVMQYFMQLYKKKKGEEFFIFWLHG